VNADYYKKGNKEFPSMDGVNEWAKTAKMEEAYHRNMKCTKYPACINGYRAYYKEWDGKWSTTWNDDYPPLPFEETNKIDAREIFIGTMNWEHLRCHSMCKSLRETTSLVDINASNLYPILREGHFSNLCYCVRGADRVVKIEETDKMKRSRRAGAKRTGAWGFSSELNGRKGWKRVDGNWKYGPLNVKYELQGAVYSCGVTRETATPDIEGFIERGVAQAGNYHELPGSETEPMKEQIEKWKAKKGSKEI
jgi:hypothetical protein